MTVPEVALEGGGSTRVVRRDDVVLRDRRAWSETIIRLLQHLRAAGCAFAPSPVGSGFASDGREMLTFIEGDPAPSCWAEDAVFAVGSMLRTVHDAGAGFPTTAAWMPWWGREMRSSHIVIGHCDAAPWNFLSSNGMPTALLDWDSAGPVGREWDVAQTAWLNAQLHDDDVAERQGLPDVRARAALLTAFCDGYGLDHQDRERLVQDMIEVAVRTAAQEAIDGGVTPDAAAPTNVGLIGGGPAFTGHDLVWAVTWRVRSARWMLQHRTLLASAIGVR